MMDGTSNSGGALYPPDAPARTLAILYFAWVREKVGRAREEIEVPPGIVTVADLIGHLRARGVEYEAAFARGDVVRVALDHVHAKFDAPIAGAREIAFFPPVTGG